ncbi:hypothetical protein BC332_33107 [Capsicum chinense]|nr:hypothetical protein BC332_33107 [Capsicum chinense]
MQSGDLDCAQSNVMISYVMHSPKKVNPMIINRDVRVLTYIMDADANGFRPILRINVIKRYDVMTTNIAKSLNSILMDERKYPVSYIFNSIAKKIGEKFRERHAFVSGKENIFVSSVERILRDNKSASDSLYVGNPNGVLNEYTVFGNGVTAKVNLLERSCSCRKFDLMKMLCEHAMAALQAKYGDGEYYGNSIYDYSSLIHKYESYLLAYSEAINVVPPEAEWTVPQELVDTKISLPPYDPKLRRKKV